MNPFGPWPSGDLGLLDKFPVDFSITPHRKEVADGGTYINASILISIRAWLFALKHIGPVIDCEWTNILPLSIGNFPFVMDYDPSIVADRDPGTLISLPEPRDD